ncbi:MAG: peroxidase-related enzyme [Rhodospirillaceae bacterium]|nr:peroxidase-related enzyme [Rhodospirillaceae bacterium]
MPQPKHIVKISLPEFEDLDDDTKRYLRICEEKLGLIPNVLRAYTGNLKKLRNFTNFYNQLMLDEEYCNLTKLEREMIAVVVSSANNCYYCLIVHGQAVRDLSNDPQLGEMLVMNYRVSNMDDRTSAMLDFAFKLTTKPEQINDFDREELLRVGFSEKDIFDICDTTAFFNYTNRMAHGLDMMPNSEYHSQSR